MRPLERRGRWQHHVGMPCGRVQVGVDADHQLQRRERLAQSSSVGGRQGGVSRNRDQGAHLPRARRLDLVRERRHRELAEHLGQPPHAAVPAARPERARRTAPRLVGGVGEHGSPGPVEVAGQHVEDVDEPRSERSECGGVGADASVDGGRRGSGEVACERERRLRRDAGEGRDPAGREACDRLLDALDARRQVSEAARGGQALGEQRSRDPGEQRGVGAGPDRHVQVAPRGRPGAPRVDDHDAPAAPANRVEAAGPVGGGGEAAVRFHGVRAEEQQEARAVDVGDGNRQRMAEDEPAGHVLRHLVDRRGGVDVLRAQRLRERADREGVGEVVRVRIPDVDGDGVGAVCGDDLAEPPLHLRERLLPAHLLVPAVATRERSPEPVGVVVERAERGALGADEPVRERVVRVTPDARHAASGDLEPQPARRLAQRACPERQPRRHGRTILTVRRGGPAGPGGRPASRRRPR